MSIEDDTELRDIVIETLDQRGVIGKTKAMLRANIFTALEDTAEPQDKIYMLNKRMREHLDTSDGQLMAGLIVEYLNFFELDFTKTVIQPETGFDAESTSRKELKHSLGLEDADESGPLLLSLIKNREKSQTKNSISLSTQHNVMTDSHHNIPKDLAPKQISEAKAKFIKYDKDNSGTIDKDELRNLFIDMFPGFHRNMLDRYVNDEFKAADADFSAAIDFDEFVKMYRRLFVTCRSVVSHDVTEIVTPRSPSPRQSKIPVKSADSPRSLGGISNGSDSRRSSESERHATDNESPVNSYVSTASSKSGSAYSSHSKSNGDKKATITDKKLTDLGFELPDEEESVKTDSNYEDDFERSNVSSARSSKREGEDNSIKTESIGEEIGDGLEDDQIDDLLKEHDISWNDADETTDRTFDDDESLKVDYWEAIQSARK